jgi:hypothetical protein
MGMEEIAPGRRPGATAGRLNIHHHTTNRMTRDAQSPRGSSEAYQQDRQEGCRGESPEIAGELSEFNGVARSVRFRSVMRIASEKSIDEPSCFRIDQEMSARMRHR